MTIQFGPWTETGHVRVTEGPKQLFFVNSRWQLAPSWIWTFGHISVTKEDNCIKFVFRIWNRRYIMSELQRRRGKSDLKRGVSERAESLLDKKLKSMILFLKLVHSLLQLKALQPHTLQHWQQRLLCCIETNMMTTMMIMMLLQLCAHQWVFRCSPPSAALNAISSIWF